MIKKMLLVGAVVSNCYAMEETKEGKEGDVSRLITRLNEQALRDNQSPGVRTRRVTDPTDYMITTYGKGRDEVVVYGEGM